MNRLARVFFAYAIVGVIITSPANHVFADEKPDGGHVPAEKQMNPRQLHDHLARGTGWVRYKAEEGYVHGTAWIYYKNKRLMITNAHVVEGKDIVQVIFPMWKDGKLVREASAYDGVVGVKAVVIDRDKNSDLALLLLDSLPETSHELNLAPTEPEEGDSVRTIGGFTAGGNGLVWGTVRGEVRTVGMMAGNEANKKVRKILTDAPINSGNSGGPLVNESGEIIGVNSAYQLNARNVSHHVSISELKEFVKFAVALANPTEAATFLWRGLRRINQGRFEFAIQDLSVAIKYDPKSAEAYYVRGASFLRIGDAETALKDLSIAVKLDNSKYSFHLAKAKALSSLGRSEEAHSEFTEAIQLEPNNGAGYHNRGHLYMNEGKFIQAFTDFSIAIKIDDSNHQYYDSRAESYKALKNHKEAAKDWAKAFDLAPWNDQYAVNCGVACERSEMYEAAMKIFAMAVKTKPTTFNVLLLTNAQIRLEKYEDALSNIEICLSRSKGDDNPVQLCAIYLLRGRINNGINRHTQAIEDLTKSIELCKEKSMFAHYERHKAYKAVGNDQAAARDLAQAKRMGWDS